MLTHSPLSQDRREIRLVRFVSAANGPVDILETTSLELQHVSLNDDISYAAVSYTWGSATGSAEIEVNGCQFGITQNLHEALRQFRRDRIESWLWIDAICIEQSNGLEKSWQIMGMPEVFGRANTVYLWLGTGCIESDSMMDFISQSKLGPFIYDLLNEDALWAWSPLQAGIRNILQRDYWHRIWIIQEVVLAKEALVVAGTKSVSLEFFDATLTAIWYCRGLPRNLMRPEWEGFCIGLQGNLYRIKSLDMRRHLRQNSSPKALGLADVLWELGGAPRRPYYTATDSRDILFGLLGIMAEEKTRGIRADYSKSTVDVFTMLTKVLISSGDDDHISFHLDCCNPGETTGLLPTWVPDWREIGMYGVQNFRINNRKTFNATGSVFAPVPALSVEGDGNVLRCFGCRVDVITEVMQLPEWIQATPYDPSWIKDADNWFRSIATFVGLGSESGPGEDYIWRTVMRNELHRNIHVPRQKLVPLTEGTLALCRKIMRVQFVDAGSLTNMQAEFIRNGPISMGFGSDSQALNDEQVASFASLWREVLVGGACSPIILRPRRDGGFYFRGDAYVDGIMQGEYLESGPVKEEFHIY
ncbi:heterokaryon incompatibility protein-domain-containing protein [Dactylonectria macrodidyma]|uniref:Heterokaryon incompatibility protein-domain-containing protein n=1 Tax=Dactylonectria macrodidyma TaxID=307937 RepID=A0A9P9DTS4_9HYPO|nr:heterokaryon incompatibility protein-domain-containing protein [Dactylonectria macrodidyma]